MRKCKTISQQDIKELKQNQPDYVDRLKAGYSAAGNNKDILRNNAIEYQEEATQGLVSALKEKGAVVNEELDDSPLSGLSSILGIGMSVTSISVRKDSIDERELEDLIEGHKDEVQQRLSKFKKEDRYFSRAKEDYQEAIMGLTTVTPLNEHNPKYCEIHLFAIGHDGVYHSFGNKESGELSCPEKLDHVKPEDVKQEGFINKYMKEANAYLVENPTGNFSAKMLSCHVCKDVFGEIKAKQKKELEETLGELFSGDIGEHLEKMRNIFADLTR